MEGDRKAADPRLPGCAISIHSLRMEGDMATSYVPSGTSLFQSTPSAWRETEIVPTLRLSKYISIHSLRMEGDNQILNHILTDKYFNPLPPHGGRPGVIKI